MPLFTALMQAQGISAHVMGPDHKTVMTLDLDLYERAVKLQSSTGIANWVLRLASYMHVLPRCMMQESFWKEVVLIAS